MDDLKKTKRKKERKEAAPVLEEALHVNVWVINNLSM